MTSVAQWDWPVPLEQYDRHPDLSNSEKATLAQAIDLLERHQQALIPDIRCVLDRLIIPLEDALIASGFRGSDLRHTLYGLLRQMHQRQTSYWVWGEAEWVDVIKQNARKCGTKTSIMCVAYLLGSLRLFYCCGHVHHANIAKRIFGEDALKTVTTCVNDKQVEWGYSTQDYNRFATVISCLMLLNENPVVEKMSFELLTTFRRECPPFLKSYLMRVSKVLYADKIISDHFNPIINDPRPETTTIENVAEEWVSWAKRWRKTSTIRSRVKQSYYYTLIRTGRWLNDCYPDITSPEQWTREIAQAFVLQVKEMRVGDYSTINARLGTRIGKPLTPSSKRNYLGAIRTFFRDCVQWEWLSLPFDPMRHLRIPNKGDYKQKTNPRIIADDIWAKLIWAGLNLEPSDLPPNPANNLKAYFPFEMVKAITITWLFSGLRNDEIRRLPVGAIRWETVVKNDDAEANDRICLLDVPVNKTSSAFTKPVSYLVGEAIEAWEQVRPQQPPRLDGKTQEYVHFLFAYRNRSLGRENINKYIIPMLCCKANVPQEDVRGKITSHRARATIASQLANARRPMSLLELMQWLGHSSPKATQHYVKIHPTKLTQAYTEAGYFDRNLRTIKVLIDQEAIQSGATEDGARWKFYDLGHGYCSYDFFDQCPHRMACAKCSFYIPKDSSTAQLLEAKANLQHMLQQIPLTDEEQAAVADGIEAMHKLHARLLDVPTPTGKTPREIQSGFISIDEIT